MFYQKTKAKVFFETDHELRVGVVRGRGRWRGSGFVPRAVADGCRLSKAARGLPPTAAVSLIGTVT